MQTIIWTVPLTLKKEKNIIWYIYTLILDVREEMCKEKKVYVYVYRWFQHLISASVSSVFFYFMNRRVHRGGGSSPLAPPWASQGGGPAPPCDLWPKVKIRCGG